MKAQIKDLEKQIVKIEEGNVITLRKMVARNNKKIQELMEKNKKENALVLQELDVSEKIRED